jgi:hypothetical protein
MKTLRKVAIVVVVVLVLAVALGALLPRTWHVEQSVSIAAPAQRIYPLIANLRRWQEWSVWTKELDPQVHNSFEGPESGVGARWSWLGTKMGRGTMEIVASDPATGVRLDEAIESATVNAHAAFTFTPEGPNTRVTWTDEGTLPLVVGGYFSGMVERMLNRNLESGLAKLKRVVEALPPLPAPSAAPAPAVDAGHE